MTPNPRYPVRAPAPLTTDARIDQIDSRRIITQSLAVLRLRRKAEASHSPLDRRDWLRARDVEDDMLDGVAGRFAADPVAWPDVLPDLITQEGGEW